MAITFVDNINSMSCYPESAGEKDVVFSAIWTKSGTDGTYNGSFSAGCELTYEAGTPFTPYGKLTQEQVLGWVYAATSPEYIANMEAVITQQINDQAKPPIVTLPLPWNVPTPAPEPVPSAD